MMKRGCYHENARRQVHERELTKTNVTTISAAQTGFERGIVGVLDDPPTPHNVQVGPVVTAGPNAEKKVFAEFGLIRFMPKAYQFDCAMVGCDTGKL
jgi:hypothetical protein